jgi:dipeptidase E
VVHGSGYLDHCEADLRRFLKNSASILFIPYALADWDAYSRKVADRLARVGVDVAPIHDAVDPVEAVENASAVFIGGGNTFRLLHLIQEQKLLAPIRKRVTAGMPYVGSSAGTNVACPEIKTTNDMPIVQPRSFEALDLIPFQINPHYLDPDPTSKHQGETREERIRQFHEMNERPVIGLREGAILEVGETEFVIRGTEGIRLFRRGRPPVEYPVGATVEFILDRLG